MKDWVIFFALLISSWVSYDAGVVYGLRFDLLGIYLIAHTAIHATKMDNDRNK